MFFQTSLNTNYLKTNWFVPVLFLVISLNAAVLYFDGLEPSRLKEFGLLFDFAVLLPALYLICYRSQGSKTVVRAIGLACLGIWLVGKIIPEQNHFILEKVSFLRYLGLAVLILIEVRIMLVIYKSIFSSDSQFEKNRNSSISETDMPEWVAKLMVWEVNLWRKVWLSMRNLFISE